MIKKIKNFLTNSDLKSNTDDVFDIFLFGKTKELGFGGEPNVAEL